MIAGLRRLHHHGLVVFAPDEGLLGVSGFAPEVGPEQLAGLSTASQIEHRHLTAHSPGAPPPSAPPAGGAAGCIAAGSGPSVGDGPPAGEPGVVSPCRAAVGGVGSGLRRPPGQIG